MGYKYSHSIYNDRLGAHLVTPEVGGNQGICWMLLVGCTINCHHIASKMLGLLGPRVILGNPLTYSPEN